MGFALSDMTLTSTAFEDGGPIPTRHTGESEDVSPALSWSKVPGFPLGFGDDDKARTLLKQALELNPGGIDPNYFYGEFLLEQKEYEAARTALLKAKNAPLRPDRPLADEGRQREVAALLEEVNRKLGHAS